MSGRVNVNGRTATSGQQVDDHDEVSVDGKTLPEQAAPKRLLVLHKPIGYICSRSQQGTTPTIYALLPPEYHSLNPVGRLDKDSSGLLLLSDDGQLAFQLSHPSFEKQKLYEVELDKPLTPKHRREIEDGIILEDGPSKILLEPLETAGYAWEAIIHEGRNRQIRRTFQTLGYRVESLHRTRFASYSLDNLPVGKYKEFTLA